MKFNTIIVAAALLAATEATPRRLRKGQLRRAEGEKLETTGEAFVEAGADAEEVVIKAKAMKSMSMDDGSRDDGSRVVDAKAGE